MVGGAGGRRSLRSLEELRQGGNVLSVGVDLTDVARVRRLLERFPERFVRRVLSESEAAYCLARPDPAPHVAARFAAKEAVVKCLGGGCDLHEIEVTRALSGSPSIRLSGRALARAKGAKVLISLTHLDNMAAAFAVLVTDDTPPPKTRRDLQVMGGIRLEVAGIPEKEARSEARTLLLHSLGISLEELAMRSSQVMTRGDEARYEGLVNRRAKREPLAYILGERGFYGLMFAVTPAVLIPRPETELLVEAVLGGWPALTPSPSPNSGRGESRGSITPPESEPPVDNSDSPLPELGEGLGVRAGQRLSKRIADIGTGSGCIAIAIAANLPDAQIFATDLSREALTVAIENARRNDVSERITFRPGDLLVPIANDSPFDLIVSNPPYIAPAEIAMLEPEVREFEPHVALGLHDDALHFYRRLANEAPVLLTPGGRLMVEVGHQQADAVKELWRAAGLTDVHSIPDYGGVERVVIGTKPD